MKQYLLLILLFVAAISSKAQMWGIPNLTTFDDPRLHFGFTLGVNVLDLGVKHYYSLNDNQLFDPNTVKPDYLMELDSVGRQVRTDIASLTPGFTVGIVTNLRLTEYLDLRFLPGLSFGNRKMSYNVPIHDVVKGNLETYQLRATYLDFPLLLKYKSKRIVNQRPYMISGFATRYDISKAADEELLKLKKLSYYVEAGMGWDVYLQFFRLSTELKYSFGLGNNLGAVPSVESAQQTYYNLAIKKASSHIFTLSFHFE